MATRQHQNSGRPMVPDLSRLFQFTNGTMPSANGTMAPRFPDYENIDLNEITLRQMTEDIGAYKYDLDYCIGQLNSGALSPQESRAMQVRVFDCSHNIRHCQHRIDLLEAQAAKTARIAAQNSAPNYKTQHRASNNTPEFTGQGIKRQRASNGADHDEDENVEAAPAMDMEGGGTTSVQRLGFWKCRLCTSRKFLDAGASRVPSAPCKWPLKDVSKMLNHFLDMHTEHTPRERCTELGAALAFNRGPFEYWLTRTRAQEIDDPSVVDELISILQSGTMPELMRGLNRAASVFPNSGPGSS